MKRQLLSLTLLMSAFAGAQTQEACFPLSQSQVQAQSQSTVTLWCQIVDYSNPGPLESGYDTGFVPLQQGFSAQVMHVQYDDWYSPMTSTVQLEFLTRFADIVVAPIFIPYSGTTWVADLPLTINVSAGDKIRITHQSQIPHACQLMDNCGMHMTIGFN